MSSHQESQSLSILPLLMGSGINITFILECSERMNGFLGEVKNLIIQTIISKASFRDSLFNIISFSYKATTWSSHMLPCSSSVVYEAVRWIHTLQPSPGSNLHTALALAFSDPACQSIYLVIGSLPDNPTQCLASLTTLVTRPVHTFYISDKTSMSLDVSDFLQCLTSITRGTCYTMSINSAGRVKNAREHMYLVEFDGPTGSSFMDVLNTVQPTLQPDIVNLSIGHGHSIAPGDTVLAPREKEIKRYEPGRVIYGIELRDSLQGNQGVQVIFWNGVRAHISKELAVWIPSSHYEQILKDLQHLTACCCLRVSHCATRNSLEFPYLPSNHCCLPTIRLCHCPVNRQYPLFIPPPLNKQMKDELERKVDLQLRELHTRLASSSDSDDSEEDITDAKSSPSKLIDRSINTEISCLRKTHAQAESRPAWRYWKRGSAEPHHKQPGRSVKSQNVHHSWAEDTGDSGSFMDNSLMTNHSSVFKLVLNSPKQGVSMRHILKSAEPKTSPSPIIAAN
ncbi:hypothetical protein DNTS_032322, partial [Danionella cerebrum]